MGTETPSTRPQNRRMVGVGRDLCGSSGPTPLAKQGHLQQAAQDLVQVDFEHLQRKENPESLWAICSSAPSPSPQTRLLKAPSSLALNTSREGASTTSLGNLFQFLTTLTVKNFFLISNINLPSFSSKLLPPILSLHSLVKRSVHWPSRIG